MSVEEHDGASEHFDAVQPITNQEPTVGGLDLKDASEHHVLDQKSAGHAMEDDGSVETGGVQTTVADEADGRESLDTVFGDKTNEEQLQRPYEPIAKTLEADKENTVNPDSVHEHADILSSSEHLASAPHKDADLNLAHVTEDPLNTLSAPEIEHVQEARESTTHEDSDAAETVPSVVEAEATPSPSLSQTPAKETSKAQSPVSEPEASLTEAKDPTDSKPTVTEPDYVAEPTTIAPEAEKPVPTTEPPAAEAGSVHIRISETSTPKEEPRVAEAKTTDAHTSETHDRFEETEIPVQLAAAVAEPESSTQVEDAETSSAVAIDQPVLPVEPLVAVDATTLAATLADDAGPADAQSATPAEPKAVEKSVELDDLHEGELPVGETEATPSVGVTPEAAQSTKTETQDPPVTSEVAHHEADSTAFNSKASPPEIEHETPPADSLSAGKGEDLERPRSPWTPSYSVTTQGPGESDNVGTTVEPEEQEKVPLSTKESTPEIVFDHVDAVEPVDESGTVSTKPHVEATQEREAAAQPQEESTQEERRASEPASPLVVDTSSLSLGSDEAKEDRPKSPWTPSYSVITQGNAVHEPAELDELDQLPPSVIESAQQLGSGTVVEAVTVEHSEPAAADAPADVDHIDDRIRQAQPADVPATNITAGEELTSATVIRVDTAVPKEEDKAVLAVSSLSEDIPPQPSSQLTADTSTPKLGDDEDTRPKSPWTPSYSVTSQGSTHGPAGIEDIEHLPSSSIEPIDHPDVAEAATTEASASSVPEAVVQGDQSGLEDLHDQPVVGPSVDVLESQELSKVPSVHQGVDALATDVTTGEVMADATVIPQEKEKTVLAVPGSSEGDIPPQLAADTSSPKLGDEEDARPKSPWTPSYSVTCQGTTDGLADIEDIERLPSSGIELVDHPDVGEAATTEASISPVPQTVVQGDQSGLEDLHDQPVVVPSVDITESQELSNVPSVHEGTNALTTDVATDEVLVGATLTRVDTAVPQEENKTVPAVSSSSEDDIPPQSSSQLTADTSSQKLGDEEDVRPKSPWTPSYSVTSQGSIHSPPEIERLPSSGIEFVDHPDVGEAATIEASASPVPEAVVQGDQNGLEDLRDQPVIVPSIDIPESQELSKVLSVREGTDALATDVATDEVLTGATVTRVDTAVPQEEDKTVPAVSSLSEDDIPPQSSSQLTTDTSSQKLGDEEDVRPKSPWTPSYSVTSQGSIHGPPEIGDIERLPSSGIEFVDHPDVGEAATIEASTPPVPETVVQGDQSGLEDLRDQPVIVSSIDITESQEPPKDPSVHEGTDALPADVTAGEVLIGATVIRADNAVPQDEDNTVPTVSGSSEDDIPPQFSSQLTAEISSPKLGDEEDARPKSPWTPSYSVTSQGSADIEGIEDLTSSSIEPVDHSDVGEAATTEASASSVPEPVGQGDQSGLEDLRDQPVVAPSINITESQELPKVPSVHEGIEVEQGDDNVSPTKSHSLANDVTPKSSSQLVVDMPTNFVEDEDRPKSPWTPSYSVMTQGNATQESVDLPQFEQLPPSTAESKEAPVVNAAEGTSTTSHSIPSVNEVKTDNLTSKPTPDEVTAEPTVEVEVALLEQSKVAADAEAEMTTASLILPEGNTVEDRPASPWTPSYSVTSQGSRMSDAQNKGLRQEDLDQFKQLSEHPSDREAIPPVVTEDIDDISVSSNVPEPPHTPQSELGIFTPGFDTRSEVSAASREPASPTSSRTDLASPAVDHVEESSIPTAISILALPALAIEHDDNTPQLTPLAIVKDVPDTGAEEVAREPTPVQNVFEDVGTPNVPQVFPGSADMPAGEAPRTIQEKPSLLRLTSPGEDGSSDRPLLSFEMPSSATSRKRLESTTSSRFFPGGWFSSSPTVPEESRTRTSLDVASGEFIRSPSAESRPSGESPASTATSVPSTEDGEDEEKKTRWCTIM